MYKILILILFMCVSCYKQEKIHIAENTPTEKKLEKVYVVDTKTTSIGYLYKYQWENIQGVERNHYFACDMVGNPIGYVGDDGNTVKFDREKNIAMGNYDLDLAIKKIFDTNEIKYRPLVQQPANKDKVLPDNSKSDRKVSDTKDESETYEDDEYNDDEYNDDEYNDEYEDDEY